MIAAIRSGWEARLSNRSLGDFPDNFLASQKIANFGIELGSGGEILFSADAGDKHHDGRKIVCELRQHSTAGAAWTASEDGYLSASLMIGAVPAHRSGGAVPVSVARIHGASGELASLQYDNGDLRVVTLRSANGAMHAVSLVDSDGHPVAVRLGDRFDCFIRVTMSTLTVSVIRGGHTYICRAETDASWLRGPLHFSAGICFDREGSSGRAEATFFSLMSPSAGRSSSQAEHGRQRASSAELIVKFTDGQSLTLPVAVPRS